MLSIGTIEILLGAGLLCILVLVLVALRAAALRLIHHDDDRTTGDRELSHLANHVLAGQRRAAVEPTAPPATGKAARPSRERRDRAA